jgi:hypothetical protein
MYSHDVFVMLKTYIYIANFIGFRHSNGVSLDGVTIRNEAKG